ncbi:MAG: c-type cytochrome, partial [Nitrospiria bacterium]
MTFKEVIRKPIVGGGLIFIALFLIPFAPLFAETVPSVDYRDIAGVGSRDLIWVIAQIHILFGAFVLGVPIFAWVVELIGVLTGERRYDRLAKEFTDLIVACFEMAATLGILFLVSLVVFYPKLMSVMANVFLPAYYVYVGLFIGETAALYLYWSTWEATQRRKGLHLFLGLLLNLFGFFVMIVPSAFLAFQASPVVLSEGMGAWERAWAAMNNPTWWPVNLHRLIGNVVLGGYVCGAYAGVAYLGAETQEQREHYDWMGYVGNFIGVFGLLPLPFAGYWLMREVYEYNQQMGITLMGGILSWLFILQAVLIGVLFLGSNIYFWQGLLTRLRGGVRFKFPITVMLVVLLMCFGVWLTPHSLVASLEEARAMGGSHHPLLGVFGVMSAKLTVVNLMILTTLVSFLLYWRANKRVTVRWGKFARVFEVLLFIVAIIGVIALGIYGYFVPAVIRVNVLSVAQVLAVLFVIVMSISLTALMLKGATVTEKMTWGIMPPSSQYALIINALVVILTMSLMGYARSASRVHWHIYGVLEDTSPYAFTPTLGHASFLMSFNTFLFVVIVGYIFWVVSSQLRHKAFATQYFIIPSFIFWLVSLPGKLGGPRPQLSERPKFFRKVMAVVSGFLIIYAYIGYQVPQKVGLPPEKTVFDLSKLTTHRDLVQAGQKIFFGKGQCALCHVIGGEAHGRCPNLTGAGARLTREFIYETLTKPQAYVKLDFDPADPKPYAAEMPTINRPPIGLSDPELLTVISFIQ